MNLSQKWGVGVPKDLNVRWDNNELSKSWKKKWRFPSSSRDAALRFVDAAMRYVTELNEKC